MSGEIARTRHGAELYRPRTGAVGSLWVVHADGHAYPLNRSNPTRGESFSQKAGDAIRPAIVPVSDDVWDVDTSGANPVYRLNLSNADLYTTPIRENLAGTVNGTNRVFTASEPISGDVDVLVIKGGARTTAYTITGASEITFTVGHAPATGDVPWIVYWPTP